MGDDSFKNSQPRQAGTGGGATAMCDRGFFQPSGRAYHYATYGEPGVLILCMTLNTYHALSAVRIVRLIYLSKEDLDLNEFYTIWLLYNSSSFSF